MKNDPPILIDSPSVLKSWILAARPKTWVASVAPVCIGTLLALKEGPLSILTAIGCLFFSLMIQIGANFANDYYDFVNGVDTEERIGPQRACLNGWIDPKTMQKMAFAFLICALFTSIPLCLNSGLWTLFIVFSCIAFAILYTGGPKPLGYLGLGDLLVFIYFGPVAVMGTFFAQHHFVNPEILLLSFCPGLISSAILMSNNLRDFESDKKHQKNTLVVQFGMNAGRRMYIFYLLIASIIPFYFHFLFPILFLPCAMPVLYFVVIHHQSKELVKLLPMTALLLMIFTLFFCLECLIY